LTCPFFKKLVREGVREGLHHEPRIDNINYIVDSVAKEEYQWRTKGGGGCRAAAPQTPSKPKFKKSIFCRYYDIKSFALFTLQLKSDT
jgi:hypothetical protein